jgi:hypothetical protein
MYEHFKEETDADKKAQLNETWLILLLINQFTSFENFLDKAASVVGSVQQDRFYMGIHFPGQAPKPGGNAKEIAFKAVEDDGHVNVAILMGLAGGIRTEQNYLLRLQFLGHFFGVSPGAS